MAIGHLPQQLQLDLGDVISIFRFDYPTSLFDLVGDALNELRREARRSSGKERIDFPSADDASLPAAFSFDPPTWEHKDRRDRHGVSHG